MFVCPRCWPVVAGRVAGSDGRDGAGAGSTAGVGVLRRVRSGWRVLTPEIKGGVLEATVPVGGAAGRRQYGRTVKRRRSSGRQIGFHARLGHSAKVSSLSDLAYRVWTTYMLAADDFGVMRADAVAFQAAHDALRTRPAGEVAACIERIHEVGLVETFEHQGARYLFQADWQDFQRVRFPARTLHPLPASAKVSARTHYLWSAHPGGTRVPAPPKNVGTTSAQHCAEVVPQKCFDADSGQH